MIKTKKDLLFYINEDAAANYLSNTSWIKYRLRLFAGSESAHVFKYLKTLRYCEFHFNNNGILHKLLYAYYKVKLHRLGFKYCIRIPINVCGYGLTIYHLAGGGGCFVNAKSIGNYCKLQTGILLGNTHQSEDEKPIIGHNVTFGPGAKVLGKVVVGDNCYIAANAVVVKDIPSNAFAAGVPAKVIKFL